MVSHGPVLATERVAGPKPRPSGFGRNGIGQGVYSKIIPR